MLNKILRKGSFDAGHRVMFQKFKELKRIGCSWIDLNLDHTFIVNPLDHEIIKTCQVLKSNYFEMHLLDSKGSCNPTVENICKKIYFAITRLLETKNLKLLQIKVYETANCVGTCLGLSTEEILEFERHTDYVKSIAAYKEKLGQLEYDSRKRS